MFCPTTIDIYGGTNSLLPGCGGPAFPPSPVEDGFFAPGTPNYDATLAGRLWARLVGDPDLVPRFGTSWMIRSCATPGQTLSQLVPMLTADLCGRGAPDLMAATTTVCSKKTASVILLSATMTDDECHGGAGNSSDDPDTYSRHFSQRMDMFFASRSPVFAMVGPRTEWVDIPNLSGNESCFGRRQDWDREGLSTWALSQKIMSAVELLPDLHPTFKQHHWCCHVMDTICSMDWFKKGEVINCDGAQALVNFWYMHLKSFLLANEFDCS
jgi:hypothetical protein